MPLQNRVDPFGEIHAHPARGSFMGNRGIIHDAATRTLLKRRWTTKSWIICLCAFKGRRRRVMGPGSYTELFFLDEATALAAGHRPCFECQRARAMEFVDLFARANALPDAKAGSVDRLLHEERRGPKREMPAEAARNLPNGAFVSTSAGPFMVLRGAFRRWHFDGYGEERPLDARSVLLLTPPATVKAMQAGYSPVVYPSAVTA